MENIAFSSTSATAKGIYLTAGFYCVPGFLVIGGVLALAL